MEFIHTKAFLKAYAKLGSRQRKAVENALICFQNDRTHPSLRDHALKGRLVGLRALSAGWDLRVIYREEEHFLTIILIDTGSHNQVY